MSQRNLATQWSSWGPQMQSVLRIVAAFIFTTAGTIILFGVPVSMPGGGTVEPFSQLWIGGILEAFGGTLLLLGLFTRPVAFILSGEMAVAYFQFHFPQSFWPNLNNGMPAVLFCFIWLYFSMVGAGPWSLDALRERAKRSRIAGQSTAQ